MPEPDISVVRGNSDDYLDQPGASDVPLVVEVAAVKGRLAHARGDKLDTYAGGGIPVYWIVNLVNRQVEVYSRPGADRLPVSQDLLPGQQVPVMIGGRKLPRSPSMTSCRARPPRRPAIASPAARAEGTGSDGRGTGRREDAAPAPAD